MSATKRNYEAEQGAERVEAEDAHACHLCTDVECEFWRWPGKPWGWFHCSCCGSRIHPADQARIRAEADMAERGMNEEQYTEHVMSRIEPPRPLTQQEIEHAHELMKKAEEFNAQHGCRHLSGSH